VAHDNKKSDLVEWARANDHPSHQHAGSPAQSTGEVLEAELETLVEGRMHQRSGLARLSGRRAKMSLEGKSSMPTVLSSWIPLERAQAFMTPM